VNGLIEATGMGVSLIHEHILVEFVGADLYDPKKWNHDAVIKKVLPYLQELKQAGCKTLVDCTPAYLGRDVILLQKLSTASGLNIITNTGYYGGSVNKYLPAQAFSETDQQLADRWIKEFNEGIDGTSIRPGFIKISVNDAHLSEVSKKLIRAAALCHLKTGLTIASHTGPAIPAFEEIEIVKQSGVAPDAFIWVHAQNEKDWKQYVLAAKQGAWVSLDAVRDENVSNYVEMLTFLKKEKCLHRVLVSHDAGWYEPHKADGGTIRGYTTIFKKLIPAIRQAGFGEKNITELLQNNPAKAFALKIRKAS
jgi:phosphotriesterase-related protein